MDQLIHNFNDFSLYRLSLDSLFEASEFIIKTNYQRHNGCLPDTINQEIYDLYLKEKNKFEKSFFYVIRNQKNEIIGTIRVLKWNKKIPLPIQTLFNINIDNLIKKENIKNIWHIGCLAIDNKSIGNCSITALKSLLVQAIYHVCTTKSILVAECDRKLFDKIKLLDINLQKIGKSQYYIGSEVIPAYNTSINLIIFLWKQRTHLYIDEIGSISQMKNKKKLNNTKFLSEALV